MLHANDKTEAALKVLEDQKNEEINFINKDYRQQLQGKE